MKSLNLKHQFYKMKAKKMVNRSEGEIPLHKVEKKMEHWKVAVLTTAGVHLKSQEKFDVEAGDYSVRAIPKNVTNDELTVSHTHYDTSDALKDINCVFPLERLQELKEEGIIGEVSPVHFGMMGYIQNTEALQKISIPIIQEYLVEADVDVLLLTPGWYICHQSVGLIQQALEKAGIATVSITHLPEITEKVGVTRALHLRFPLGRSFGAAGEGELQRTILIDMLQSIEKIEHSRTIVPLPYRWKKK